MIEANCSLGEILSFLRDYSRLLTLQAYDQPQLGVAILTTN